MANDLMRFSVAMPEDLLIRFDRLVARRGLAKNRSEVVRDLVRDALIEDECALPGTVVMGTLTIVYDRGTRLAPELLGEDGTVGIRVTREAFSANLCRKLRRPLVSTSANISGEPAAALFPEISEEIINGVDYVVDYRRDDLQRKRPSTVMRLSSNGVFKILRP